MDHLPPWLRDVPLPPRPRSRSAPDASAPDWLGAAAEVPSMMPPPASSDSPDWLMSTDSAVANDENATPDWLRELQAEVGEVPMDAEVASPEQTLSSYQEHTTDAEGEDDAPDWLRQIDQSGPVNTPDSASLQTTPEWLSEPSEEAPGAPPPEDFKPPQMPSSQRRFRMPVGATDWLRSMGEESEAASEEEASLPFDATGEEQVEAEVSGVDGDIPDWLQNISPEELEQDIATTPGELSGEERSSAEMPLPSLDELPDWLRGDDDDNASSASSEMPGSGESASDWFRDIAGDTPSESQDIPESLSGALPSWLAAEADAEDATPSEDLPGWLQESNVKPQEEASSAKADATQDWLRGDDEARTETPEAAVNDSDEGLPEWLRVGDASHAETPEAAVNDSDEGLPEWLRVGDASHAETPKAAVSDSDEGLPEWLRVGDTSHAETPEATVSDAELPDWLQGGGATPAETPEAVVSNGDEGLPDWLQGGGATPAETPEAAVSDSGEGLPEWLGIGDEAHAETPEAAVSDGDEGLTGWLRGEHKTDVETPEAAVSDAGLPDWLQGGGATPAETPEAAVSDAGLPDWLYDQPEVAQQPSLDETSGQSPDVPWLGHEGSDISGLPNWLRGAEHDEVADTATMRASESLTPELSQDAGIETFPAGRSEPDDTSIVPGESDDFFGGADLPSWLRPPEPSPPAETPDSQALGWLSRLGFLDEEDADAAVATTVPPVAISPRPLYQMSPQQLDASVLLRNLAAMPYPEVTPEAAPPQPTIWQRIGLDRALYVVFALVIIAGFLVPSLSGVFQVDAPQAAGAAELEQAIEGLDADDIVLLAYEWDAQRSSELVPLEQAVTGHLIERRVGMVLLSTDQQGTILSFNLRDQLREADYQGAGRDYVLLGYRPGGELALRNIAQNLRVVLQSDFAGRDASVGALANDLTSDPPTPRLQTVDDVALVVVMADHPQDVQGWIEQVHRMAPNVPMAFLMPSETEPIVQPYLRSPNVLHLAGKQGALAYTAARGAYEDVQVAQSVGQQSFTVVAFVVLVLIGGVASALFQRISRRQEKA